MPKPPSDPRNAADSFFAPDNEVLDVYTGDTLEEAMAGAVAALGPDLEVRRARKVRTGVRGLMGRPVYEVLAVAGRSPSPGGDPLRSAVNRLLERADAQEARGTHQDLPSSPPRGAARPAAPAAPPQDEPFPETRADLPRRVRATGAVEDRSDVAAREHPGRRTDPPRQLEAPRPAPLEELPEPPRRSAPDEPQRSAPGAGRTPGWSRAGLARIGVPAAVLNALPRDAPSDDLGWLVSVTAAIAACVGPPAGTGPEHPVVVNGFGLSGVLGILEAGCRGATPGRIAFAGRTADATALELALVLHASLTGR